MVADIRKGERGEEKKRERNDSKPGGLPDTILQAYAFMINQFSEMEAGCPHPADAAGVCLAG
jgi:hypothetical protein